VFLVAQCRPVDLQSLFFDTVTRFQRRKRGEPLGFVTRNGGQHR
jgi:hypothetical protein